MATDVTIPEVEKKTPADNGSPDAAAMRQRVAKRWANPRLRGFIWGSAAALLVIFALLYFHFHFRESTDDAQVDGHIDPISSKIYGTVAEVLVNDNQQVKAGQVLARIDPRDLQAKLDQMKAELAQAESKATGAKVSVPMMQTTTTSGTTGAEAQVAAAQAEYVSSQAAYEQARTSSTAMAAADVAKGQADYDKAQADLQRMKPLAAKDEISKQQFDAYVNSASVAESELKSAQEKLQQAQQNVQIEHSMLLAAECSSEAGASGIATGAGGDQPGFHQPGRRGLCRRRGRQGASGRGGSATQFELYHHHRADGWSGDQKIGGSGTNCAAGAAVAGPDSAGQGLGDRKF